MTVASVLVVVAGFALLAFVAWHYVTDLERTRDMQDQERSEEKIHVDLRELPDVLGAVVLGPDDRLVLVFPRDLTQDQAAEFRQRLVRYGFADRVLIVAGVEELAVLRGCSHER